MHYVSMSIFFRKDHLSFLIVIFQNFRYNNIFLLKISNSITSKTCHIKAKTINEVCEKNTHDLKYDNYPTMNQIKK